MLGVDGNSSNPDLHAKWGTLRAGTVSGYTNDEQTTPPPPAISPPLYSANWSAGINGDRGAYMTNWSTGNPLQVSGQHWAYGGSAEIKYSGTATIILKWKPRPLNNQSGSPPDTSDLPPKRVLVVVRGSASALTETETATNNNFQGLIHGEAEAYKVPADELIELEHAEFAPEAKYTSGNSYTTASASAQYLLLLDNSAQLTEIVVPPLTLKSKSTLDSGRRVWQFYYDSQPSMGGRYVPYKGSVKATAGYDGRDVSFQLLPDPEGLALMDCAHPELSVVNQYIMSGSGGAPFLIGCSANFGMETSSFDDRLRDGFGWSIARPPLPMLAAAPNGLATAFASTLGRTVSRRSYPPDPASPTPIPGATPQPVPTPSATPSATPLDGMGFDTRGGLPASNGAFGLNQILHQFGDPTVQGPPKLIATADVALFYEATAKTHPPGGPPGYFHTASTGEQLADHSVPWPTSNWIYYYDQVWKNQWALPVVFWTGQGSYWLSTDPSHVHIGGEAHGLSSVQTDLFAIPPGGTLAQKVGAERTRGIDTYIRVVTHEAVHSRLAASSNPGVNDNELDSSGNAVGDGVPDAIESQLGLDPTDDNTAGFSYGGDEEVFARMCEYNLFATAAQVQQDWADDGLNKGAPPPPNLCQRTAPSANLPDSAVWRYPNALSLVP